MLELIFLLDVLTYRNANIYYKLQQSN